MTHRVPGPVYGNLLASDCPRELLHTIQCGVRTSQAQRKELSRTCGYICQFKDKAEEKRGKAKEKQGFLLIKRETQAGKIAHLDSVLLCA